MRTLSFGLVDNRAVFMDLATDSYFTLDPAAEECFQELLWRANPFTCDAALPKLLGVAHVIQANYTSPAQSLVEQSGQSRGSLADVIKTAALVRSTRSWLRALPIETLLGQTLSTAGNGPTDEPRPEHLLGQVGRFLWARKLVPLERNCLLDSLSLLRWLGANRSAVALLFGVKLDPFAAHCWVQLDELVLNDRLESVASFTPVRVIRCSEATR